MMFRADDATRRLHRHRHQPALHAWRGRRRHEDLRFGGEGFNIGGSAIGTAVDNDILAISYDGYKARWVQEWGCSLRAAPARIPRASGTSTAASCRSEVSTASPFRPLSMAGPACGPGKSRQAPPGGGGEQLPVSGLPSPPAIPVHRLALRRSGPFVAAGQACNHRAGGVHHDPIFGASVVSTSKCNSA